MGVRALSAVPTTVARAVDPDVGLVAAAREQPRAFLALYDRYFERVLGYVRVRIGDVATCEEVTSQVFTTALAQISRFRGEGSFAGWLFQIARNSVLDVQRRPAQESLSDQAALVPDRIPGRKKNCSRSSESNGCTGSSASLKERTHTGSSVGTFAMRCDQSPKGYGLSCSRVQPVVRVEELI